MEFLGNLDESAQYRAQQCDARLMNKQRLRSLQKTGLMYSSQEKAFDRLATLAAKILNVPLTIISLIDDKNQFFKAGFGLPPPYDVIRQISINESICRYTLHNQEIIASDAKNDAFLKYHPTIEPWGIGAFVAIPMTLDSGDVLGAFCAVDSKVREWSDLDLELMRELTSSVMTEINLRLQIDELQEEQALRERLMVALSHDLRNPLNVAKMGVALLEDPECSDEDRIMVSTMINENVDRADKMIQSLLTSSRMKAGEKVVQEKTSGDLNEVVQAAIPGLTRIHKRHFHVPKSPPIIGVWDADSLRRIIENLVGNAVKYGDVGRPITVRVDAGEEGIRIAVHNFGPPIPEHELIGLFNLFERATSAETGSQKGWGIGLTIVKSLAEQMNGTVAVESSLDEGTTFIILLPRSCSISAAEHPDE